MRLVNPEFYGWEIPQTARLEHQFLVDGVPTQWLSVGQGAAARDLGLGCVPAPAARPQVLWLEG